MRYITCFQSNVNHSKHLDCVASSNCVASKYWVNHGSCLIVPVNQQITREFLEVFRPNFFAFWMVVHFVIKCRSHHDPRLSLHILLQTQRKERIDIVIKLRAADEFINLGFVYLLSRHNDPLSFFLDIFFESKLIKLVKAFMVKLLCANNPGGF